MAIRTVVLPIFVAVGLGACGTIETSSRDVPLSSPLLGGAVAASPDYALSDIRVTSVRDLRVSERNGNYPLAEILRRGDPIGDRYDQIEALFETAGARAAQTVQGDRPIVVLIQITRFQEGTERTRHSVGGDYHFEFRLTVADAETGAIVEAARMIEADLPAPDGNAAVRLEQGGQTERVRLLDFLTFVLERELGPIRTPGAPEPIET